MVQTSNKNKSRRFLLITQAERRSTRESQGIEEISDDADSSSDSDVSRDIGFQKDERASLPRLLFAKDTDTELYVKMRAMFSLYNIAGLIYSVGSNVAEGNTEVN